MSVRIPLRAVLTSDGQADYDFTGRTNDGSTFGPGQKVVIGPFILTNHATTPASNDAVPYGGITANPATGPADYLAPMDGKLIGMAVTLGTAFLTTTTSAKFIIAIAGTTNSGLRVQPSIGAGNLTKTASVYVTGSTAISFSRGQRVGVRFTSGSTVNPATVEAYVNLLAEM